MPQPPSRFCFAARSKLLQLVPFHFRSVHLRRLRRRSINARQPVGDQHLAEVRVLRLDQGEIAMPPAPATRILFTGADGERARELLPRKALGLEPDLECLWNGQVKILRLLLHSLRNTGIGFRRIDKVESEDVFPASRANVKAIAVIRCVGQVAAIRKGQPSASAGGAA